jgi:outer membrane protein assembly factor BamA
MSAEDSPQIRQIRIVSENVFQDAETSLLARVADAVHGVTHEQVIRRELLFAEGERLDPAKLVESERNLRALGLFRRVEIRAIPVGADEVDVVVRTRDSWTTEVSGSVGRAGGKGHYGISLEEKNLFGTAKKFSLAAAERPDRSTREILYSDPQFLGRRLGLEVGTVADGRARPHSRRGERVPGQPSTRPPSRGCPGF